MQIALVPRALHSAESSLAHNARRIRPLRSRRHLGPEPRRGGPLEATPRPPVPCQALLETPAPCAGPQDAPSLSNSRATSRYPRQRLYRLAISLQLPLFAAAASCLFASAGRRLPRETRS